MLWPVALLVRTMAAERLFEFAYLDETVEFLLQNSSNNVFDYFGILNHDHQMWDGKFWSAAC